ncbi:hypothetical protein ACGFYY_15705 [Streptomyces sp. NPDC048331]|uniref:hypothetical protein n=1 Tax=Streptomyces sp. NPDC048331 TaxID=3365534 RepID=UPI003717C624
MKDPFGCDDPSLLALGATADRAAARRAVAAHATDPEDLARLLDILGLLPAPPPEPAVDALSSVADAPRRLPPPPCDRTHQAPPTDPA